MEYYILECGYTDELMDENTNLPTAKFSKFLGSGKLIYNLESCNSHTEIIYQNNCINPNDCRELIKIIQGNNDVKTFNWFGRGAICFIAENFDKIKLFDNLRDIDFCEISSVTKTVYTKTTSGIPINYVEFDSESG